MSLSTSAAARLIRPWAHPTGLAGRIAGWEMAHGKTALNERIAQLLAPAPSDRVLELGYGPGTTLHHLARLVPDGRVVGVDPSTVMFEQARRRNQAAVDAGRVELHLASAERLPFDDAYFDKALTVHSLLHWSSVGEGLSEVHRTLRPGGTLLIGLRGRQATGTIEATETALADAGFVVRRVVEPPGKRQQSTLLLASRPATT
jgi:ubiquinone/menaquinone biosynthesis C-methylase UbiE